MKNLSLIIPFLFLSCSSSEPAAETVELCDCKVYENISQYSTYVSEPGISSIPEESLGDVSEAANIDCRYDYEIRGWVLTPLDTIEGRVYWEEKTQRYRCHTEHEYDYHSKDCMSGYKTVHMAHSCGGEVVLSSCITNETYEQLKAMDEANEGCFEIAFLDVENGFYFGWFVSLEEDACCMRPFNNPFPVPVD